MKTIKPALRSLPLLAALCAPLPLAAQQASGEAPQPQTPLPWAYPLNTPGLAPEPDDGEPRRVPGSEREYLWSEISLYNPPDWHPEGHPPMPPVVGRGREPEVFACGYCHLPNGQGKPENSSLAGLPAEYIVQQMRDYKAGLRTSSEPQMGPPSNMRALAMNVSDEEVAEAAAYFSSLTPKKWIRVVETGTVPENVVFGWKYIPREGGGREALGRRILEMPENVERTELRDDASGFVAYVPPGSIARGRALVRDGGDGRTLPCAVCHGDDLRGLGPVPSIAGRSPSYLARQLYDLQSGNRRGLWSPLMRAVVEQLSPDDILAISAYAASLDP